MATVEIREEFVTFVTACEAVLRTCARDKRVIYYTELADLIPWTFDFRMPMQQYRALLADVLYEVALRCAEADEPLLPALVVGKGNGRPSGRSDSDDPSGFWAAAQRFGRDLSNPDGLLLDEQAAVYVAFA